jgi:hypothetical protein
MVRATTELNNTTLKWRTNGELSDHDLRAITAKLMVAERRPFTLPETTPMTYVALVADMRGKVAWVYGNANSWESFVDQLEDQGCEVIENETDDWDNDEEAIKEDCIHISALMDQTDFIPID